MASVSNNIVYLIIVLFFYKKIGFNDIRGVNVPDDLKFINVADFYLRR